MYSIIALNSCGTPNRAVGGRLTWNFSPGEGGLVATQNRWSQSFNLTLLGMKSNMCLIVSYIYTYTYIYLFIHIFISYTYIYIFLPALISLNQMHATVRPIGHLLRIDGGDVKWPTGDFNSVPTFKNYLKTCWFSYQKQSKTINYVFHIPGKSCPFRIVDDLKPIWKVKLPFQHWIQYPWNWNTGVQA